MDIEWTFCGPIGFSSLFFHDACKSILNIFLCNQNIKYKLYNFLTYVVQLSQSLNAVKQLTKVDG